jgi:hypothetical protein
MQDWVISVSHVDIPLDRQLDAALIRWACRGATAKNTRVRRRGSVWIAIIDMATSMDRDEFEPLLSRHLHGSLDGFGLRQRCSVGAEEHEAHLAIAHAASQVDDLIYAKREQLLGGHLAQCAGPRIFGTDCMHVHGNRLHRGRFSGFRWDGGICDQCTREKRSEPREIARAAPGDGHARHPVQSYGE